jgi:alpha-L-fucosidase
MKAPGDSAEWSMRFTEPGDYRLTLEYACPAGSKGQEGIIEIGDQKVGFETLFTTTYDSHQPLIFVQHAIGIVSIRKTGTVTLTVHPKREGAELFWLRRAIVEPVR